MSKQSEQSELIEGSQPKVLKTLQVLEKCCGLDVHKKTCTAAIVTMDKQPQMLEDLDNNSHGIHHLHQRLVDEGCTTVVMESSGSYWTGIYDYFDLRGLHPVLVNPRSLKAITGKKTDTDDSVWLAHLYRINLLKPSYVPPQHIRELRALTRRYEKITDMATSVKNSMLSQVDAFSTGITTTYTDPFGAGGTKILSTLAKHMDKATDKDMGMEEKDQTQSLALDIEGVTDDLRQAGLPGEKVDQVGRMLKLSFTPTSRGWMIEQGLGMLRDLQIRLEELLDRVAKHIQKHRDLSRSVRLLLSIKGVDLVSAATIVAEMGDPARFEEGRDVGAYFGLVPSVEQSGPRTVLGGITKNGSPHMRRILVQVAWVVSMQGAAHLRRWFNAVRRRRGGGKAAVALARKILVIAWAMLRDGVGFIDPEHSTQAEVAEKAEALRQRKLRALERRAQRSKRSVSVWEAMHLLATDPKIRGELGLCRVVPTVPGPVRAKLSPQRSPTSITPG